ncbi:hypothetical protein ACFL5A_03395 [Gemmatimonadota bacterium]
MKRSTVLTEKNRAAWATAFAILIILPVGISILGLVIPDGPDMPQVFLEEVDPRWEACVQEASYMRFRHMDVLKEERRKVIREGLKGGITLAGCGDCHVNRDQFCDKCHEEADVILDCWGCHYYLTAEELAELGT